MTESESKQLTPDQLREFKRRARVGFLWIFSTTVIWQVLSWVLTLFTARILGAADYGVIALSETVLTYLLLFATLQLDVWLVQADDFSDETQGTVLALALVLAVAATAMLLIVAPLAARFYENPELVSALRALSLVFLPRAVRLVAESRLRREVRFESIAMSNLVVGVSRGAIQLGLAMWGFGFWSLVWGNLIAEFAQSLWMIRAGGLPRRLRWNVSVVWRAGSFGLSVIGSMIFWIIYSTADNICIGKLFGAEVLGYYAMAFYLTDLPLSKINSMLTPVVGPYYSRLKHNAADLYRSFLLISRIIIGIIAPVLVGLALTAPEFVDLILGSHWKPMVIPLQVLAVVGLLRGLNTNGATLLTAIGRPNAALLASAVPGMILPPAFYFAGSAFGLEGIYAVWLGLFPFVGPVFYLLIVSRVSGLMVSALVRNMLAPLAGAALLAAVVLFVDGLVGEQINVLQRMVLKVIIGAVVYVSALILLYRRDVTESLDALKLVRS